MRRKNHGVRPSQPHYFEGIIIMALAVLSTPHSCTHCSPGHVFLCSVPSSPLSPPSAPPSLLLPPLFPYYHTLVGHRHMYTPSASHEVGSEPIYKQLGPPPPLEAEPLQAVAGSNPHLQLSPPSCFALVIKHPSLQKRQRALLLHHLHAHCNVTHSTTGSGFEQVKPKREKARTRARTTGSPQHVF